MSARLRSWSGVLTGAVLVVAWCALWGTWSVANLLSGLVLVGALSVLRGRGGLRIAPVAALGLAGLVAVDLVRSTWDVGREVLTRRDSTAEGVIAVDLAPGDVRLIPFLVGAITLTPGTAVSEADPAARRLILHLLHADRAADVRRHVDELIERARRAFPSPKPEEAP